MEDGATLAKRFEKINFNSRQNANRMNPNFITAMTNRPRSCAHLDHVRTESVVRRNSFAADFLLHALSPASSGMRRRLRADDVVVQVPVSRRRSMDGLRDVQVPDVLGRTPPRAFDDPFTPDSALVVALKERTKELGKLRQTLQICQQRQLAMRAAQQGSESVAEDCPICLDGLTAPGPVLARCGHMFHLQCILQHVTGRLGGGCPICRRAVHQAELVPVVSGIPAGGEKRKEEVQDGQGEQLLEECKNVLGEVERKLEGVGEEMVEEVEGERRRLKRGWKEEVEGLRERFEREMGGVRDRERRVDRLEREVEGRLRGVERKEGDVEGLLKEVKKRLEEVGKREKSAEEREKDVLERVKDLGVEREEVRKERERVQGLLKFKVTEGEGKSTRENEKLKREVEELKKRIEREREGKRKKMETELEKSFVRVQTSAFKGSRLPTKRGTGLGSFVPKRAKVQRPLAGVAGGATKLR